MMLRLLGGVTRRRLIAGAACSLVLHLSLLGLALWARSWLPLVVVRKGEPLLIELPPVEPDEVAPRGTPAPPAAPTVAAKPKPASPRPAPKAEAPRPAAPRVPPPPLPEPARTPEPAVVAKAEPLPAPAAVVAPPPSPTPKEPEVQRLPEPEAKPAPPIPEPGGAKEPASPKETDGARTLLGGPRTDLAALPPTPGGVGGLRRGRGGVEGEPIPLDTPDPRYTDYFEKVRQRIKSKWIYPREAGERGIGGQLVIDFAIAKNGDLDAVELRRSSGVQVLDLYALNAIKLAQPFPPVPDSVSKGVVPIKGIFTYQIVDAGLLNQYLR